MIPKLSSQDLNKEFQEKKEKIDNIENLIKVNKEEYNKKLMVINYVQEFANKKLDMISAGITIDKTRIAFDNNVFDNGMYNQYGYEIHPKFKSNPIDIFNLSLPNGGAMFKQNMKCKVNNVENEDWITVLQNESIPNKPIIFDEYYTDTIKVEYEIDNTLSWGVSRFNLIEIEPWISGAYNIASIECFNVDTSGALSSTPIKTISNISNIGKTRIVLNEKIKFSKVIITFKCNFETEVNNNKIYPFGIKHILFQEADFITNSCAIIQATFDDYVEYVYNNITLYTVEGKKETTCDYYGIEVYTTYEQNTLLNKVKLSSDAGSYRIAKNTKSLFVKIPLLLETKNNKEYLCLNGIKLNISTKDILVI